MRRIENECVGCPAGVPCFGSACPMLHVEHIYCDLCGEEAEYVVDSEDLCEECAKKRITETFNHFDMFEQADMLDIGLVSLI